MRKTDDNPKKFKNSVFCEFAEMATVTSFLTADPKPTWKGQELLAMSK